MNKSSLLTALAVLFDAKVEDAVYCEELLQGGTVGNVIKVSGEAKVEEQLLPFVVVLKVQKKWDRHGDPDCWRREYDIYKYGLAGRLSEFVKLPKCYLPEEGDDCTRIWMEYVEGRTGADQLHADELALAAKKLGELQARWHLCGERDLPYLRSYPAVRSSFDLYWRYMKEHLSAKIDGFPDDIRERLCDYGARAEALLNSFDKLPWTICQGDVHHENLIMKDGADGTDVYLIDWDCAGYGRMGEDAVDVLMEAFVYSDREVSLLPDFRRKIVEGYCEGAKLGGVAYEMTDELVRSIFALAWGIRIADHYVYYFREDHEKRARCVEILRAMLMDA